MSLTKLALQAIENYKSNAIIMDFINNEAAEKTASDIRLKTGSGTTAKAVQLLIIKNEHVRSRFNYYVNAGLVGCYLAAQK